MQKSTSSKSTIIALVVIVAVALLLYFYYKGNPNDDSTSSLTVVSAESQEARASSDRVLSLLSEIRSLNIKNTLFTNPVYKSLVDYTIAVPDQPIGRINPFAPVGSVR